jgi:hypothetical protein
MWNKWLGISRRRKRARADSPALEDGEEFISSSLICMDGVLGVGT